MTSVEGAGDGSPAARAQEGEAAAPWPSAAAVAAWVSAVAAAHYTLVYYPGVLYSDSYQRWRLAHALLEGSATFSYLSLGPSLWMAATYAATGSYAAYTLLQAFLFFFSTLLLVARLGRLRGAWVLVPAAVLVLYPLFPGYAVYHEGGMGAVIGMNVLFLAALWEPGSGRLGAALRGGALLLALFTIFSFRQNALTVAPAAALLLWKTARSRTTRIAHQGVLGISLAAVLLLPALLGVRGGSSGIGFAWEMVGTLKRAQDPAYDGYLDYVGDTRAALAADSENGIWNGLVSPRVLPFERLLDPAVSARLRGDYLRLAAAKPAAFLANKWAMTRRTLGIGQPLFFFEFDENRSGLMPRFGYRDTPERHRQFERVGAAMGWSLPRTPWLVFLLGLGLVGAARRWLPGRPPLAGMLLVFAALYYAAFLVTTQAYEFRYFFPALHLVVVLALVVAAAASRAGLPRLLAALAARRGTAA